MESNEETSERGPSIELVRASTEDVDAYVELEKSIGSSKTYSAMTTSEEALDELSKSIVYFIKENAKIVGSVSYVMKAPNHAYIDGLLVTPSHQGHGLGRAAMLKILDKLKGVELIDLVTHPDNVASIKLYQSLGFTVGKSIENYFGDGEPRIVMTLKR